jgi:hypothetical protein
MASVNVQRLRDAPIAASVEEVEDMGHRARRPAPRMREELSDLLTKTPERTTHDAGIFAPEEAWCGG